MTLVDLAVVALPLIAAGVAGFGGRRLGDSGAQLVTCGAMSLSALLSVFVFYGAAFGEGARTHIIARWIESGSFVANWAVRVDTLSAIMMLVVTVISALVHIYSIGYMKHDKGVPRFMAYLSLFTFFMLMLVSADNLLQMFFGWEGVGLASYLLIGYWYEKPSARAAAMKAFWVNRVGDFGFLLGILACVQLTGAVDFDTIFKTVPQLVDDKAYLFGFAIPTLTVVALFFFMGAMGKSAQLGLHTWLPDAMEGPTPVSALIHAATMVTAGVFMLARLSPLFEYAPDVLAVVAIVGAVTAVVAASIGMTQFDIKRVIAYSTMSQLGYMFFAAGVSAYGAAIFHLATHAFFKALLFLAAGSVIHALGGEQDMRKMGGLRRKLPWTYALMWIGSLSLAGVGIEGVFGFAGAYSKDMILEAAFASGTWQGMTAFLLGLMAAFMTAFYAARLIVMTFHGKPRGDDHAHKHAHESPPVMLAPLVLLGIGAVFAGAIGHEWFAGAADGAFWRSAILVRGDEATHEVSELIKIAPLAMAVMGLGLALFLYLRRAFVPRLVAQKLGAFYRLVARKYYFDDMYEAAFVRLMPKIGAALWHKVDEGIIDRFGPDGAALAAEKSGERLRKTQTGYVDHYALVILIGLVALALWALLRKGW